MKIVIDTNRIIASLIKEGTTRSILFDNYFRFITPDHSISEINKYEDEIIRKAKITKDEFELLLDLIFENVEVIPKSEYMNFFGECKNDIIDKDDIPFLALCLADNAEGIWTHDYQFKEQNKVKVFTNKNMLKASGKLKKN